MPQAVISSSLALSSDVPEGGWRKPGEFITNNGFCRHERIGFLCLNDYKSLKSVI